MLGSAEFHEATHLQASDWDQLQHTVRHRVLRYFHRHGLLDRHVTEDMLTWQASGGFSIDASVHTQILRKHSFTEQIADEHSKRVATVTILRGRVLDSLNYLRAPWSAERRRCLRVFIADPQPPGPVDRRQE